MEIGKYIKDTIKSQGRTITWVSDQLGFNERTFAGKLNRNSITGEDLIRISDLLGINLEQLKEEMLQVRRSKTIDPFSVHDLKLSNTERLSDGVFGVSVTVDYLIDLFKIKGIPVESQDDFIKDEVVKMYVVNVDGKQVVYNEADKELSVNGTIDLNVNEVYYQNKEDKVFILIETLGEQEVKRAISFDKVRHVPKERANLFN